MYQYPVQYPNPVNDFYMRNAQQQYGYQFPPQSQQPQNKNADVLREINERLSNIEKSIGEMRNDKSVPDDAGYAESAVYAPAGANKWKLEEWKPDFSFFLNFYPINLCIVKN